MRKFLSLVLVFLLLCGSSFADPVTYGSVSADPGAEYIDLGDQTVKDYNKLVSFLRQFPDLKKVDMYATQITEDKVNLLVEAFPEVEFGWTLQMMRYHIIRSDAVAYSTLHGKHPNHSSREFSLLKYCTKLLALDLGHNNLTDISFLRSMPHLRVLIFGENQKLQNIEEIASLPELEYLELFTCGIVDISPLTKLTRLMDLNLANNKVQDWRPLKEMTWLKRLWISGMCAKAMTAAEKQELRDALPDTEIMFTGQPTDNGWRKLSDGSRAPHYDIVYRIFQTGQYIPFEESAPLTDEDPFLVFGEIETEEMNGQ